MEYKILKEKLLYDGFFKLRQALVRHDTFRGGKMLAERLAFGRTDAVAILAFEQRSNSLLFVRQFRYPTIKEGNGWLLEIPAGGTEIERSNSDQAQAELLEETGYNAGNLEFIMHFFTSPGAVVERIFLYYTEVDPDDRIEAGGGADSEKEDTELVRLDVELAYEMLQTGQFRDAKTIIALQWFFAQMRHLL